jgi:hypothetical protein
MGAGLPRGVAGGEGHRLRGPLAYSPSGAEKPSEKGYEGTL